MSWPACPEQTASLGAFWDADEADDGETEAAPIRIQDEGGAARRSRRADDRGADGLPLSVRADQRCEETGD
jgi:hypothetical protein